MSREMDAMFALSARTSFLAVRVVQGGRGSPGEAAEPLLCTVRALGPILVPFSRTLADLFFSCDHRGLFCVFVFFKWQCSVWDS